MQKRKYNFLRIISLFFLLLFFLLYVYFNILNKEAPIDYKTFMEIGHRFRTGQNFYGENSYYPIPFVMVFAFFDWLPRELSLSLWLLAPVFVALAISGFSPLSLLYAPLIGHFLGGQSVLFGLLGFWGYRKYPNPDKMSGGIWLALTTLKPQLAIAPCLWAFSRWWLDYREKKRVPKQALGFIFTVGIMYLPGFFLVPNWVSQWLSSPRPLFLRALSGLFPRTLLYLIPQPSPVYWILLALLSIALFLFVWFYCSKKITLDILVLFYFVVSPFVHDYDLIQLMPMLETTRLRIIAILLSTPGWVVIFTQYANDSAWVVFTIIAPGLLIYFIRQYRQEIEKVVESTNKFEDVDLSQNPQ
ncbi:MAG: hypothetical protein CVU39_21130 [Chloroflexi bacterium HGW-Chloroflexi-10]|nr:MAG: hypothetical protein CVU39_21130 [Chloroflexi bacterium HGW-Chloroflexi-10]